MIIKLYGQRIGCLFKYQQPGLPAILRFAADEAHARSNWNQAEMLSESMRAQDPPQQQSLRLDVTRPEFNTVRGSKGDDQRPRVFQNMLPEGVVRRFVADEARIDPLDHMDMIAACCKNLPGAIPAEWGDLPRVTLQRLVTQNADALEATVWAEPFQDALSTLVCNASSASTGTLTAALSAARRAGTPPSSPNFPRPTTRSCPSLRA